MKPINITPKKVPLILPKEIVDYRDEVDIGSGRPREQATRRQVFAQNTAPTGGYAEGDLWFDSDDNNTIYRANSSLAWVSVKDGAIATAATTANWSGIVDDDSNKPANNATVGATFGTDVSGGGSGDNQVGDDGYVDVIKAQHIIAPSNFTAGEDLTAGDAAYFKASDSKIYKADTDADESTYNFIGFVRNTEASGQTDVQIITGGIITKAAWGLTAGSWYFLTGTAGAVGTTPGTRVLEVGIAISATELLIVQRKPRQISGTATLTGTTTSSITTGFRPARIWIFAQQSNGVRSSNGSSDGTVNQCVWQDSSLTEAGSDATKSWRIGNTLVNNHTGICDTFSATGFRLNQTKAGGADLAIDIHWLCLG